MKKIAFLFTGNRKERLVDIKNNKAPADFFYGALELRKRGYNVELLEYSDFSHFPGQSKSIVAKLKQKIFKANDELASVLFQKDNLAKLNQFDVLVTTTNGLGLSLARLARGKKLRAKLVFFLMGVMSLNSTTSQRISAATLLKEGRSALISQNELKFLEGEFPALKQQMHYVPFGIDHKFWQPGGGNSMIPYIFSIGNDANRDYETLLKAWKKEYPLLRIVTKRQISAEIPANVKVEKGDWHGRLFSDLEIRTLMQESLFGIIPSQETIQPAGQSACLQMMACAKAVVFSKIVGLWDESVMRPNESCRLYKPGSINELQSNIEFLLANPEKAKIIGAGARKAVEKHFTIKIMVDELEKIL